VGHPLNHHIVRLGAATGEHNFFWEAAYEFCHVSPGRFQGLFGRTTQTMAATGVSVLLSQVRFHDLYDLRVYRGGSIVVQIDHMSSELRNCEFRN